MTAWLATDKDVDAVPIKPALVAAFRLPATRLSAAALVSKLPKVVALLRFTAAPLPNCVTSAPSTADPAFALVTPPAVAAAPCSAAVPATSKFATAIAWA